jgi:hypothetical protein
MRGYLTFSYIDQAVDGTFKGHLTLAVCDEYCDRFTLSAAHTQKQLSSHCYVPPTVPPLSIFTVGDDQMGLFSTAPCHHSDHGYSPTHFYSPNDSANLVHQFRPSPFPGSKSTAKQPLPTTVDRAPEDPAPATQTPWQPHHWSTRRPLSRPGSRPQPLRLRSNPERSRPTIGHLWQRTAQAPSR